LIQSIIRVLAYRSFVQRIAISPEENCHLANNYARDTSIATTPIPESRRSGVKDQEKDKDTSVDQQIPDPSLIALTTHQHIGYDTD
jgi:hypothetical protein